MSTPWIADAADSEVEARVDGTVVVLCHVDIIECAVEQRQAGACVSTESVDKVL